MSTRKEDAFLNAFMILFCFIGGVLGIMIILSCIFGSLSGHWEPDIAVGFWAIVLAIGYGIYRLLLWRSPS